MSSDISWLLGLIAFAAGVGVSAIGPGGIFLTIALFAFVPLSPAQVAGTASAAMVVAGIVGSLVYLRSGELEHPGNRESALVISLAGVVGGLAGSWLNSLMSARQFSVVLGVVVVGAGAAIVYQERRGLERSPRLDETAARRRIVLWTVGLGVGVVSGLVGVGGPVLSVPALVLLGTPMLSAIAIAQVQSVFISLFAAAGYAARGAVVWPLVALVGVPLLLGVCLGWVIARRVAPRRLKMVLGAALLAIGPYLAAAGTMFGD